MGNPLQIVKSRHGVFALIPVLPMSLVTLIGLVALPLMILSNTFTNPFLWLNALVIAPWSLFVVLKILTTKVSVTLDRLEFNHIWAKHNVTWEDVTKVYVWTNYFSRYDTYIYLKDRKRPLMILTSYIGNYKRVGQAIIEAATLANPKIKIEGMVVDAFGKPPYNIFTENTLGGSDDILPSGLPVGAGR